MTDKLHDAIMEELSRQRGESGAFLDDRLERPDWLDEEDPWKPHILYDGEIDIAALCQAIRVALNIAEPATP